MRRTASYTVALALALVPMVSNAQQQKLGDVPHYLPGKNPYLTEFAEKFKLPVAPTRGGAATMYPEYVSKVKAMPIATPAPKK